MVVTHPELAEKARKKAEYNRAYSQRLRSDATRRQQLNEQARERMRRLRESPAKREEQAAARRAWRSDPANAEKIREQRERQNALEKARRESDPAYREESNRKAREKHRERRQDPALRALMNAKKAERKRIRMQRDAEYKARVLERNAKWKKANPERAKAHRQRQRKTERYRSIQALRRAVHRAVVLGQKRFCSRKYLGIDLRHAKHYIESMLRPGWTWENHGKLWHIDHIFPIARANLSDPVEVLAVSNYRNLRPLSVQENNAKKDKITAEARLLFEDLKIEAAETLAAHFS